MNKLLSTIAISFVVLTNPLSTAAQPTVIEVSGRCRLPGDTVNTDLPKCILTSLPNVKSGNCPEGFFENTTGCQKRKPDYRGITRKLSEFFHRGTGRDLPKPPNQDPPMEGREGVPNGGRDHTGGRFI